MALLELLNMRVYRHEYPLVRVEACHHESVTKLCACRENRNIMWLPCVLIGQNHLQAWPWQGEGLKHRFNRGYHDE